MNLNPRTINAVVPFAEGSASGNQGKKLEQIDPSINIYQLFEIDPSEFGVDSLAYIKNITTAYCKLSCLQHPDRHNNLNDNKTTNANFVIIKEAYDILKDPVKHQEYNDQNHVSNGFPLLSRRIDKSKHECDHKKLDSCMQHLTENQLHTVVHHLYRLRYEKSNVGDKQDEETISNNKQYNIKSGQLLESQPRARSQENSRCRRKKRCQSVDGTIRCKSARLSTEVQMPTGNLNDNMIEDINNQVQA